MYIFISTVMALGVVFMLGAAPGLEATGSTRLTFQKKEFPPVAYWRHERYHDRYYKDWPYYGPYYYGPSYYYPAPGLSFHLEL